MIVVNLLPKSLKRVEHKIVVPYKAYVLMAVAGLLLLHVLLFAAACVKKVHVMSLRGHWERLAPQSKEFVARRGEFKTATTDVASLESFVNRPFSLTEMFSVLAGAVPPGLWLDRFSLSAESLVIQGSVVSLNQSEMTIIGKFLEQLRASKTFSAALDKIELNSVQRRTVKSYDVVDFVLVGERKKGA
ncbi:MAG: PilN domain-containing protein [Deltaproteobacteria bacterium]